jgi:phosphate-selective porin OprO/OprP
MRSFALALALAPAAAAARDAPAPLVGYEKGFFLRSPDDKFELKIGAHLQFRYTYERDDAADESATAFQVARGRIKIGGHVWDEHLLYKIQFALEKGQAGLKDYVVDYGIVPSALWLRAGQFKRPFTRHQLTSSGELVLVDRAITDKAFGAGRDIGVALGNRYEKAPPFEWVVGVFNGTGESTPPGATTNVPEKFHPQVVARAAYNHGGIDAYSQGDLKGGPLRFAVGANAVADFDVDDDGESGLRAGVDAVVKVHHFSIDGEFLTESAGGDHPFADTEREAIGGRVDISYLFGNTMPAARFAVVSPTGDDNDTREMLGGLGFFFHGHQVKWQTDAGVVQTESADGDLNDVRVRTQLNFAF